MSNEPWNELAQFEQCEPSELALTEDPGTIASRFLQLATLKVVRWQMQGQSAYRLDRAPFSQAQRKCLLNLLSETNATKPAAGWRTVEMKDGGRMAVFVKYLEDSAKFDTLNILVDQLTAEITNLIYKMMAECKFLLLPMSFAANDEVAQTMDIDWPDVEVIPHWEKLHELLVAGPFQWWKRA